MVDSAAPPPPPAPNDGLTDEERQTVTAAAIAAYIKNKNDVAEATAAVERAAAEAKRADAAAAKQAAADAKSRKESPLKWVGVWSQGDITSYYPNANPKENDRTIVVSGKNHEHTHEDADGVWIYRQM